MQNFLRIICKHFNARVNKFLVKIPQQQKPNFLLLVQKKIYLIFFFGEIAV